MQKKFLAGSIRRSLSGVAAVSEQKLPKNVLRGARVFPFAGCCGPLTVHSYSIPCDKKAWDVFPWSAAYSGQPPTTLWIFKIWLWHCWLICVLLWKTMHNGSLLLLPSLPQTNAGCFSDLFISRMHTSKGEPNRSAIL